ncbi:WHG domain-containing protein [Mobilicoccus caccae]|uniref:WHG domain-containing protein n=1 Tax=Mobilicoccus caccae TaxID=1859295 RepID=UPI0024E09070|nr:WHG domain-containing protein [Mobilicoccus caccae]
MAAARGGSGVHRVRRRRAGLVRTRLLRRSGPARRCLAFRRCRHRAGGQARLEEVPPFAELLAALEDCVTSGALSAERRAGAEFSCWSAVHGCAELMVHGPLRGAEPQVVRAVAERVVDDIIVGIQG